MSVTGKTPLERNGGDLASRVARLEQFVQQMAKQTAAALGDLEKRTQEALKAAQDAKGTGGSLDQRLKKIEQHLVVIGNGLQLMGGEVRVVASKLEASGSIKGKTVIADSVVGGSYTPGAGNIW